MPESGVMATPTRLLYALERTDEDSAAQPAVEQFLTFRIASASYAIPLTAVQEIIRYQRATHVPDVAPHIAGVINLRGTVVPIVDVRIRLGFEPRAADERTCIVVVHARNASVGLLLDTVSEVARVPLAHVESPPRGESNDYRSGMIRGLVRLREGVTMLVDVDQLLFATAWDGEQPAEAPVSSGCGPDDENDKADERR